MRAAFVRMWQVGMVLAVVLCCALARLAQRKLGILQQARRALRGSARGESGRFCGKDHDELRAEKRGRP
eukprot:6210028-Pleurochrysis_carterae.AAC.2